MLPSFFCSLVFQKYYDLCNQISLILTSSQKLSRCSADCEWELQQTSSRVGRASFSKLWQQGLLLQPLLGRLPGLSEWEHLNVGLCTTETEWLMGRTTDQLTQSYTICVLLTTGIAFFSRGGCLCLMETLKEIWGQFNRMSKSKLVNRRTVRGFHCRRGTLHHSQDAN